MKTKLNSNATVNKAINNSIVSPQLVQLTTGQDFINAVDENITNDSWVDWNENFIKNLPADIINFNIDTSWKDFFPIIVQAAWLWQTKTIKAMIENPNLDFSAKVWNIDTIWTFVGASMFRLIYNILENKSMNYPVSDDLKTAFNNQADIFEILLNSDKINDENKTLLVLGFVSLNDYFNEGRSPFKIDKIPSDVKVSYDKIVDLAESKRDLYWIWRM